MIELHIKPGYLYLLKNNILGGYKIGITTNPASRFKALQVGTKATLFGYWQTDVYRELEKHLHKQYAVQRVPQSEWFNLSEEEIRNVIQNVSSLGTVEFLLPELAQSFVGPQYKITKVPPYKEGENATWQMFGLLIIALVTGYLLGS
jgi:predicted GIY-YIG superfamily endonuclease